MFLAVSLLNLCFVVFARHANIQHDEHLRERHGRELVMTQAGVVKTQDLHITEADAESNGTAYPAVLGASTGTSTNSAYSSPQTNGQSSNNHIAAPLTALNYAVPSYIFPTSVVQVAVATICLLNISVNTSGPYTKTYNGASANLTYIIPPLSITSTSARILANVSTHIFNHSRSTTTTDTNPIPNSVTLPAVSALINQRTSQPRVLDLNPNIARIAQGDDDCQTIYTPKTTASCDTTVNLAGLPPVSVTNCNQWITFSTARALACVASLTASELPLGAMNAINTPQKFRLRPSTLVTNLTPTAPTSTTTPVVYETLYYIAHWWDLFSNPIPSIVRVETCAEFLADNACAAHTESWKLRSELRFTTGTIVVTYDGPVVFTSGTYTFSTSARIDATTTTTRMVTVPTIIRRDLSVVSSGGVNASSSSSLSSVVSAEATVTLSVTVPTTKTWVLEAIDASTTTVTSAVTATITSTVVAETRTQV